MSGSIKVGGNTIATHTGAQGAGEVTLGTNIRLPASGGIQDSSGNNILTESGGTVTFGNVIGGVPAGAIMSFAMSSAPSGWIICNGAEYAIADYGDLHTAIGTTWGALTNGSGGAGSTHFRVPDLRGAFMRGTGTGTINARNKAGASVGVFQEDEIQGHYHNFKANGNITYGNTHGYLTVPSHSVSNFNFDSMPNWPQANNQSSALVRNPVADLTNGDPRTGLETIPYNASVQYCIKY